MYEAESVKKTDGMLNLLLCLHRDPYERNLKINVSDHIALLLQGIAYIDITILLAYLHIILYNYCII